MLPSPQVTLLHVQLAPSSIWKRRSPCSSACCPAEALWVSPVIMTMLPSFEVTLLHVQRAPSSNSKRRSPCSSACCPAEALRAVTIDHDDVIIAAGDVVELDLEAKEPM
jgi:hypothetical protein